MLLALKSRKVTHCFNDLGVVVSGRGMGPWFWGVLGAWFGERFSGVY